MHLKRDTSPQATCPKVKDKQLMAMVAKAWAAGWWCELGGSGHVKCYPPPAADGSRGRYVTVANTPSDHRTVPNTRAQFRRSGLPL